MLNPAPPGEHAELQRQESADGHSFQQGDKVKCLLEVDILRQMQEGHGGWNPKMAEVLKSGLQTNPTILNIVNRFCRSVCWVILYWVRLENLFPTSYLKLCVLCPLNVLDKHGLTVKTRASWTWHTEYLYKWLRWTLVCNRVKENRAYNPEITAAKGNIKVIDMQGRPMVKRPLCVCSTFAGSGLFIESLTEEMLESNTATTSVGLSILGPSPRYWDTNIVRQEYCCLISIFSIDYLTNVFRSLRWTRLGLVN